MQFRGRTRVLGKGFEKGESLCWRVIMPRAAHLYYAGWCSENARRFFFFLFFFFQATKNDYGNCDDHPASSPRLLPGKKGREGKSRGKVDQTFDAWGWDSWMPRVWTRRACVRSTWMGRAHVFRAISRKSICRSFLDKAKFESWKKKRKRNVTRAERTRKLIYSTDFNSTFFVFIRDSSASNEFHILHSVLSKLSLVAIYGTHSLNSRS